MNLLEQAINCNDGSRAAKMIRDALGIESDDVANYCFPKEWPANHELRAAIKRRSNLAPLRHCAMSAVRSLLGE